MDENELATALDMVKKRLNRLDNNLDSYLTARTRAAYDTLIGWGIHPDLTVWGDMMTLVDLTVWQYSNRDAVGGMPEWLRKRRNDRWLQERR